MKSKVEKAKEKAATKKAAEEKAAKLAKEQAADPFSKGQIFSDMKVIAFDKKSVRPVHFVYVKRGAMVHVPGEKDAPGKLEWSETAIARDPKGNVLWQTDIHMMLAADFKNHIEGRTKVGVGVI